MAQPVRTGRRWAATLTTAALVVGPLSWVTATASTAAGSNLSLAETAPATVLYGQPASVTLTASNPNAPGGTAEYNVSFTDTLPAGVTYVPGSISPADVGAPQVVANATTGQTVLIWANVSDLQPSSSASITFGLQAVTGTAATTDGLLPGASYHDNPAIYGDTNPRTVPQFATGTGAASNYSDTATATTATTQISPIQLTKTGPATLLRGVHDHPGLYQLKVANNSVNPTDTVIVDDYLPADLEFLGCGGVDNTTDAAGTNPGSTREYPGAPALGVGLSVASTPTSGCQTPTSVTTVTNPAGYPAGVYTHVQWSIGNLAATSVYTLEYFAGIPLRNNTATFANGAPTGVTAETANLDNNNGAETYDGETTTNQAVASGTYTGPVAGGGTGAAVSSASSLAITAKDLVVAKSVDDTAFVGGQLATFSIGITTGEYRYTTNPALTDVLPSGTCPISAATNFDGQADPQCAAVAGDDPTITDHVAGTTATIGYTSVSEGTNGTFTATWDLAALPAGGPFLPPLAPNANQTITYRARDRSYYQSASGATTPTLNGDALTNTVAITGDTYTTCENAGVADPRCTAGGTPISAPGDNSSGNPGEPAGPLTPSSSASATQTATQPTISKEISVEPPAGGPINCATTAYVSTDTNPAPVYQQGDEVCFRLEAAFPAGLYSSSPKVTDFLPPNTTYVPGSAQAVTPVDTVTAGAPDTSTAGEVSWALGSAQSGGTYTDPGQVFEWDLAVTVNANPTDGNTYDVVANLMKFTSLNTAGQAVSLRDQATYDLSSPVIGLAKAVTSVNGAAPGSANPQVQEGNTVGYTVTVSNTGLEPATGTVVWDQLPAEIPSCAAVTTISAGGRCFDGSTTPATSAVTIEWTGLSVAAATLGPPVTPGTTPLTYDLTIPTSAGAGDTLTNNAGVVSYNAVDDQGANATSYPANNIDPAVTPTAGIPAANASASVHLAPATLAKTAAGLIDGTGKGTVGEPVRYTLTATIPAGTTVYGATVTDPLGTSNPRETYLSSGTTPAEPDATATLNGGALPGGFTVTGVPYAAGNASSNTVTLAFPGSFTNAGSGAATFVVTFYAQLTNVAANTVGQPALVNHAALAYASTPTGTATTVPATASTTIVEPKLTVAKHDTPGGPYQPGATVTYTVTVKNTGTSAASDLVATDTLPAGVTAVTSTSVPAGWAYAFAPAGSSPAQITWTSTTGASATTLAAGAQAAFAYTLALPDPIVGSSIFTNNVAVTGASLDTTTYPAARTTYSAATNDTVQAAGPTITKSASPTQVTVGEDTTYTVTATVPAGVMLPDATIEDVLPDGMTFDAYGTGSTCTDSVGGSCGFTATPIGTPVANSGTGVTDVAWYLGNLAADPGTRAVTVTYTAYPSKSYHTGTALPSGATLTNSVDIYWANTAASGAPTTIPAVPTCAPGGPYCATAATAPLTVLAPVLALTKQASTASPTPGVPFTYTLTVTNTGTAPAVDPTVTDSLPAGVDPTATTVGTPTKGSASVNATTGLVTWSLVGTTLAPGAGATLVVTTQLAPSSTLSGAAIVNTATIPRYYDVPTATQAAAPGRYLTYGPTSSVATVTPVFPAPTLTKTEPGGSAATVGTPFAWRLSIGDTTAAPASGVAVTDTLPASWTYDAGTTTITPATGPAVTGAAADPVVTTDPGTGVETLTWSAAQLGTVAGTAQHIVITYDATPTDGAARANLNAATVTALDGSGASSHGSGASTVPYSASSSATAVIQTADLSLAKTVATPGGLVAGATNDAYALAVTNNGPDAAADPTVTDTAPAGTTFTGGSGTGWTCSVGTGGATITCDLPAGLAANASGTVTVAVAIPSSFTGPLTNTAHVTSTTHDPQAANNTASVTAPVASTSVLAIAKSHTGALTAGAPATYQLTVTDNGPSDYAAPATATDDITVTDTLPAGETYTSATGPGWTCSVSDQTVTCALGTGLAAGSTSSIQLTVAVAADRAAGSTLTNDASVTNPLTSATASTVDPGTVTTAADLSISKTHTADDSFIPGDDVVYDLAVANAGPSVATAPVVTDTLPASETYVSATGTGWACTDAGQTVTCDSTADLAVTQAGTITLTVRLSSSYAGGDVENTASVTSATPSAGAGPGSSTDMSTTGTAYAGLTITKTHTGSFTAGSTGVYHLSVGNTGPSDASGPLALSDTLPAGEIYVSATGTGWTCTAPAGDPPSGGDVTCQLPAGLAASAMSSLALTVAVGSDVVPGTLVNSATVSSPTPLPAGDATPTATDPTTILTTADLSVTKSDSGAFTPGTDGTYQLVVANSGPSDAPDVVVTDPLPAGETFVSAIGTGWSCTAAGQLVTCDLANPLAAGTTATPVTSTVTLTVAVDPTYTGGAFVNTAHVASTPTDPGGADSNTDTTVTPVPEAHLTVTKTHTGTFVPGTQASYRLVATNAGPSDNAGPVVLTDPLPAGETYVSATGTGWDCTEAPAGTPAVPTVTCQLAAGLTVGTDSAPVTLTVALDPSLPAGTVDNTVTVTSGSTNDPDPGATATDTADVVPAAALALAKTHTGDLTPGADGTYTLQVTNAGPSDAAGPVTVTDPLPTGETFVSATGTGWVCTDQPATAGSGSGASGSAASADTVTCTLADGLAAGTTAVPVAAPPITLTVAVGAAAYPSVTNTATVTSPTANPSPAGATASDTATVDAVADLSLTKTHTGTAVAGVDLTYELAVANAGPTPDPGPVTVTDPLPAGETYVSATGTGWTCTATGSTVVCATAGALPLGAAPVITLVVQLGAVASVANTATAAGTGTDPVPANNSATDTASVTPAAALTVTKALDGTTLTAGGTANYTITVANPGPSPATGVTVTDTLPAGLVPLTATGTGWTCTVAGQAVTCAQTGTLAVDAESTVVVTATVTATGGSLANAVTLASGTSLLPTAVTAAHTAPVAVTVASSTTSPIPTAPSSSSVTPLSTVLATTGLDTLGGVGEGAALIGAGIVLVLAGRRRRRS
jgi:uncharacterized repeat protein (TIGR01451 family)/fimbrial isopeptide formation D2 family protein